MHLGSSHNMRLIVQSIKHKSQEEMLLIGMLELKGMIWFKNYCVLSDCLLFPQDSKQDWKSDQT